MESISNSKSATASRPTAGSWLGGVCLGVADLFNCSVLLVRLTFVLVATYKLLGVLLYLVFWLAMPPREAPALPPGLEAATRRNLRTLPWPRVLTDTGIAAALLLLGGGLCWLFELQGWGLGMPVLLPSLLIAAGLAALWREVDRIRSPKTGVASGGRYFFRRFAWPTVGMVLLGLIALVAAIFLVWLFGKYPDELSRTLSLIGLSLALSGLAVLPWFIKIRRESVASRAQQLLNDARADMAAHLHDSVLQTLALIQRRADDPKAVAALARRQERELRAYLYGETTADATLSEAISRIATEVEDTHQIAIEPVFVGDIDFDASSEPLVAAVREAMVNAAKHSGVERVDVFTEVTADLVSVYVRDRGSGFDMAQIPEDRLGVKLSIGERMSRAGGRAIIRTVLGEGTEVRLELPR